MEKFNAEKLPQEQVQAIREFIKKKRNELDSENVHLNAVLREDIFPLLDRYCTVIYFPIEDSENNGFHVSYPFNDQTVDFVFINTAQDREKQIFTAAHELGHIWELDNYLKEECGANTDAERCEQIMNRFAAEFLMPHDIFGDYAQRAIEQAKRSDKITIAEMVQAITVIMNEFFAPYKSVVCRLYELDMVTEIEACVLWGGTKHLPREVLEDYSRTVAQIQGFGRLYKADRRRAIAGLKELLDSAKREKSMPAQWIEAFYKRFDLEYKEEDDALDSPLQILEREDNADA